MTRRRRSKPQPEQGKVHRCRLEDRNRDGIDHSHRWLPSCSCGWVGVPGKTKWARQQLVDHRRSVDRHTRVIQKGRVPAKQKLTPRAELPELLQ